MKIRARSIYNFVAILGVVFLMCACSGTKKRLAAELVPISNPINLERVWSDSIGKSDGYSFQPILVDGSILTASSSGDIYRIDPSNGKRVWAAKSPNPISTGPGSDGRLVSVATIRGDVYAFDMNSGAKLWETSVGTEVLTEPLVAGGFVVIRTVDNRFIGLDAATGKRAWVNQRDQSALSLRASYSMNSINNEVIFTGFTSGKFGLLTLKGGNLIWESLLAPPKGASEIERLSDVTAKPTLYGSRMCAVSFQGGIGCGEIKNAAMSWSKPWSSFTGVSQTAENVFSVNEKSFVAGFNANNGKELWVNESMVWRDLGAPLAVGRVLLVGDSQGYLHMLEQDSGAVKGRVRVDSSPIVAAPIASNGLVIVQAKGGTLSAYRIQ